MEVSPALEQPRSLSADAHPEVFRRGLEGVGGDQGECGPVTGADVGGVDPPW